MKNIVLSTVLSMLTLCVFATKPHTDHVAVNIESSTIKWIGSKISESHDGIIKIKKGELSINHGTLVGGQVTIDMNSIQTQDMSEKYNKKLDAHLKDEDFFNVAKYPDAIIDIRRAKKGKDGTYKISADLTIKGITHSIDFIAELKINGPNYTATADIKIDRTKWDIKYNSGSFFKDLGDKLILDEIEFKVFLVSAKR